MSDIILFHFEQSQVRYVGDGITHEWIAKDVADILGIQNVSQAIRDFSVNQKGISTVDTLGGEQKFLTVKEPGLYRLIFKSRKAVAQRFQDWVVEEVIPSIRKTGGYSINQDKAILERQFLPEVTAQNRIDALKLLKIGGHDKLYIQRVSIQMAKAICPEIGLPDQKEMISLPTAKAFLTPTEIAVQLNILFSTGAGNAIKVNKLLADLGYQEKIGGQWSATDKATANNLCDRKPVQTNSRTQKDQLLWSADVVLLLKEHVVENK
jgi:prophage antirepressor-like protein